MGLDQFLPHDLLVFANQADFLTEKNLPDWAQVSLDKAQITVVRRGRIKNKMIPVGVRGYERNERLAGYLSVDKVIKHYHPWDFIENKSWQNLPLARQELPAFQALIKIIPYLKDYHWGISGSLAYEMATGVIMVKNSLGHSSDLDIIMEESRKLSPEEARRLLEKLNQFGVHADVQVVHGQNGFALEEYAQNFDKQVLVKTADGPRLSRDPWQDIQEN